MIEVQTNIETPHNGQQMMERTIKIRHVQIARYILFNKYRL